jgi:diguanylate cyclase (GGDEF)-like protein
LEGFPVNIFDLLADVMPDLLLNAMLLFVLFFVYTKTRFMKRGKTFRHDLPAGLLIGLFMVFIMMTPFVAESGVFFDTRTVLISLTGVFFGLTTTLTAASVGILYRIGVGGSGMLTGVLSITLAATIGLLWNRIRTLFPPMRKTLEYFLLGVIVHVFVLAGFVTLPSEDLWTLLLTLSVPYLTVYPLITMLIGVRIEETRYDYITQDRLKEQRLLLQAMIDSTETMEMFAVDHDGHYLSFNRAHRNAMRTYYGIEIREGMNYLGAISIPAMKDRIGTLIRDALSGTKTRHVFEVEGVPGKYLEEHYSPIESDGIVIGATVFSKDISDRIRHEHELTHISLHDAMTGLKNRRAYIEDVRKIERERTCPVSIAFLDINGLKITNDAFGHEAGDTLLKKTTEHILSVIRDPHVVYRIGGDEFLVLMHRAGFDEADRLMGLLRDAFEGLAFRGIPVSLAYGVSTWACDGPFTDALKEAEDRMYSYKIFEMSSHRSIAVKTILNTLKAKNPREERHSARVSKLCRMVGGRLRMAPHELMCLETISTLHDIGKIGISDTILNKQGPLSQEEWAEIRKHPEIGYRILASSPDYVEVANDILSHHERYDGTGYPRGLKGEDIPLRARIIAIADAYDAMTSMRPYRNPLTHEEAVKEIEKHKGTQFDPEIADIFIEELSINGIPD